MLTMRLLTTVRCECPVCGRPLMDDDERLEAVLMGVERPCRCGRPRTCCCTSTDAMECARWRGVAPGREPGEYDYDDACSCACHDDYEEKES